MYSFANDYSEGCHPKILEALNKTNDIQTVGYGLDEYCLQASDKLKKLIDNDNVDLHYIVGGTQTNLIVISAALRPHQAVIAASSGHINVHETGAIESTGHKVLTREHQNGKLTVDMINEIVEEHCDEHMVQPKMVYISQSTEYGTVYSLKELQEISACCKQYGLYLFIDGARLGSALAVRGAPTLKEIANLCDVLYIGGTKMGALFGECVVITNDELKPDFRFYLKQKGAMLAKGRLLGIQFNELFSNNLYLEIGEYENKMADILKQGFKDCNIPMYIESPSNQLFPILSNEMVNELSKDYILTFISKIDENHKCMRLVTSFATKEEEVIKFVKKLGVLSKK